MKAMTIRILRKRKRKPGNATTHGMSRTKIYNIWCKMVARCCDPGDKAYDRYGGRGIGICDEWRQSFEKFYADMGDPPKGKSLDRRDNDLGYCKSNCRWATAKEQADNRRSNVCLEFGGKRMNLIQWSVQIGLPFKALWKRYNQGWSVEEMLTIPKYQRRK